MADILDRPAPAATTPAPTTATRQAWYTICPTFVASNVAQEFGWIEEELRKVGASLSYLRGLPVEQGYLPHFSHRFEHLFRDGGNIPSIWAKADNVDTTLIGLTEARHGGTIVVRADDPAPRVAALKGRRFGLSKSDNPAKVDWWRATSEQGVLNALRLAGLTREDVAIVDIAQEDRGFGAAARPSELWARRRADLVFTPEARALQAGEVDAIFASHGRALGLVRTGSFKIVEDFSRYPDWTLQVSNSPYALTVNTDFARANRDIVVAFLRASVRAARWLAANPEAGASILHRVTYHPSVADTRAAIRDTDFLPTLSERKLAGIDRQKAFLVERGYVRRDFDSRDWADGSYLDEALATS
ncbi:ABC transporter substrate-binding protein [Ancylobacter sp. G4_0304]|uniref:ABC transporter substrate-binding protein n=1 Tax=Ancylobacter sp. G4_0304 TaxID=3114289 RepID=UPI0039C61B91